MITTRGTRRRRTLVSILARRVFDWSCVVAALAAPLSIAGCVSVTAFSLGFVGGTTLRGESADSELSDDRVNGCGPGTALGVLVPECPLGLTCFTPACNNHDWCYTTCGADKTDCDDAFYADLLALCQQELSDDALGLQTCESLAYIYWQAVARFGQSFFDEAQEYHCGSLPDKIAAPQTRRSPAAAPFA